MNQFVFTGRLGRDAELRYTTTGKAVCGFSVANDIGYGEKKSTQWIKCTLWEKRAVSLAPYLVKGLEVTVSGEVTVETWTPKDGEMRASLAVNVTDVDLHGKAGAGSAEAEHVLSRRADVAMGDDLNDDVPF